MNITATWHLVLALGTTILASIFCTEAATVPVIANLRMNLSADTVDPNDSSQVQPSGGNLHLANWVDQSGNGCNALQDASNAQPIYVANALNGKPVIRFNGSSNYLSTSLPQIAGDKTLFVVQYRTISTAAKTISSTASTGHFLGNSTSTNETKGRLGVAHDLSLAGSLNTVAIKTFIRAGGTETLRLNAATPVSSTSIPDVANGNYTISSSNYPFGGDIAEVIIYDRALSESERLVVEAYLEQKWVPTVITSATAATGTVGGAFSYQIAATNGPTSYGATGLPAGLSVNPATGAITGTPAVVGTYSITLAATNAAGTGTATLTLTVSTVSTVPVIANLRMNLSADTVDPNDSSQVQPSGGNLYLANWADQSGNGCNALQGASNAQPIYVANVLNGKPVIRFNGSSNFLSTSLPQIAGDKTLFVVQRRTGSTAGFEVSSTASTGHYLGNDGTAEVEGRLGIAPDFSVTGNLSSVLVKTFMCANGTETFRIDTKSSISTPSTGASIPDVANGNYTISSNSYPFAGDIAEVLIYDRAISESERLAILWYLELKWMAGVFPSNDIRSVPQDIQPPPMVTDPPAAGKRVRQTSPEYAGTAVYHTLYLPTDWTVGKTYPVIVDYAGNYYPSLFSTGNVEDISMGYGLSGGRGYIWVCMPTIGGTPLSNQNTWWGDLNATKDYCLKTILHICQDFGGDPSTVILSGFSRGAIGCNYIGLADNTIADVWLGFVCHSHYDDSVARLERLKGRSQHISQETTMASALSFIQSSGVDMAPFTFSELPYVNHTDTWASRPIQLRSETRTWLQNLVTTKPGAHSISGMVTDSDGTPLSGVTIQSGPTHFTVTDGTGNYVLAGLIDSNRTVSASASGYLSTSIPVTVAGASLTDINFTISRMLPPVITSATAVTGTVGSAFSYQIAATNGPPSYGATGLPAGLSVNPATGAITGTPAVAGTYSITLAATNAAGTGTATLTLTVSGASLPVITSATTVTWTVSSPFSYQITATNNPTSYGATGLPAGLSVNPATGAITGTPAVVGTYSITLAATNVTGTGNATLRFTVSAIPTVPVIANLRMNQSADTVDPSDASQVRPSGGNLYLANWVDQSGNGCNALQATSNAQPIYVANVLNGKPVIRFNGSSNYLSTSLPQIAGNKTLFVVQRRTNSTIGTEISSTSSTGHFLGNNTSTKETKGRLSVAHDLSLAGSLNTVAIKTFIRAGGTETLRLNAATPVSSTSIPDVANGNYTISSSNYPFGGDIAEVIIYDRALSESERLVVEAYLEQKWTAPVITSAMAVTGTVGSAFSYQITASGDPMSYNATSLPGGLIFSNSTGLISGTPTQTGTFSSSISAISSRGTGSAILMITIENPFDAWKRRNFTATELLDASISGDEACPCGDGISNLMKYALNMNSRAYDRTGLPIAALLDTGNGTCLTLSYTRVLSASDITYTVEVSGDMRTWNSGAGHTAPVSVMNSPGGATQSVVVQDLIPISNAQQRFIRLRVTRP